MAHTFGSTILSRTSAATSPITRAATTAAGDTVLVLFLDVKGGTDRAGGAPTWNGVSGVQANSTQKAASSPEAGVEVWYWTGAVPSGTGSLFIGSANIVIPNTGSLTIFSAVYTGLAATGFTSAFDAANGTNATSTNPTTNAIVSTVNGAIYFAAVAGGWQSFGPSARTGTSLYETDDGATGGGGQYLLQGTFGSQAMTWTQASDDWGAVGVAFKEVPAPNPAAGTLTLAGLAPSLALAFGIAAGALGFTGYEPSVNVGPRIEIPAGTLTLKGPARPSSSFTLSPDPASLTFTGYAPTALATTTLAPDVGTLVLTGQAPSLALTNPVDAGALAFTGYAPSLAVGVTIEIGTGSLVFKGPARPTTVNTTLEPGVGSLAFTGYAPSLALTLPIDVGALTLTGYAPTVSVSSAGDVAIPIAAGALTLSGVQPSIGNTVLSPDAGSLSLEGQTPTRVFTLITNGTFTPDAAALTLTGYYVGLAYDGPAPAALVLTGYAPTVSVAGGGQTAAPDVGTLTLTGYAPSVRPRHQPDGACGCWLAGVHGLCAQPRPSPANRGGRAGLLWLCALGGGRGWWRDDAGP
jgi:hypothetical protein